MDKEYFYGNLIENINGVYIHWDITTRCNFNCEYCYAKNSEYKDNWNKDNDFKIINNVLKNLANCSESITLNLLGGEPTQSKYYFYIVNQLFKKILKKNDQLRLTTNLSKNIKWWKKHNNLDKFSLINISFHPFYFKNENMIKAFINKVLFLKEKTKINLIILLLNKYEKQIQFLSKNLNNIFDDINITPMLIIDDYVDSKINEIEINKSIKKFKYLFEKTKFRYFYNNKIYRLDEIFLKKLYNFYNWDCEARILKIDFNGKINDFCNNKIYNIEQINFVIKKLIKNRKIKCKKKYCLCENLLSFKKERIKNVHNF